jgi:rod shape determining protein RodA
LPTTSSAAGRCCRPSSRPDRHDCPHDLEADRPPTLIWFRTDWGLLIGGLGLSLIGALLVWSATGGFSIQPSEFAKVALCVGLAVILAERGERDQPPSHRDVAIAWVVAGIPIGLVMLQPDLGSALVLAALTVGVIAVSGAPRRWVVGVLAVAAIDITVALTTPVLSPYQRDRLVTFANSSASRRGSATRPARSVSRSVPVGGRGMRNSLQDGSPHPEGPGSPGTLV